MPTLRHPTASPYLSAYGTSAPALKNFSNGVEPAFFDADDLNVLCADTDV